jgi:hypothetical protein
MARSDAKHRCVVVLTEQASGETTARIESSLSNTMVDWDGFVPFGPNGEEQSWLGESLLSGNSTALA